MVEILPKKHCLHLGLLDACSMQTYLQHDLLPPLPLHDSWPFVTPQNGSVSKQGLECRLRRVSKVSATSAVPWEAMKAMKAMKARTILSKELLLHSLSP